MPISILSSSLPRNLRDVRDLSDDDGRTKKDWSEIMEDSGDVRVNIYDLEGDFPKPSSKTYDKGIIQYHYHEDSQHSYNPLKNAIRRLTFPTFQTVTLATPQRIVNPNQYEGNVSINAPDNEAWITELVLDDYDRNLQNLAEKAIMEIDLNQIQPSGAIQFVTLIKIKEMPMRLVMSTNKDYIKNYEATLTDEQKKTIDVLHILPGEIANIKFYSIQDNKGEPNEDYNYIPVTASDSDWETQSNTSALKPLERPSEQTAYLKVVNHNGYISQEPETVIGEAGKYELAMVYSPSSPPAKRFSYSRLERLIKDAPYREDSEIYENVSRIAMNVNYYPANPSDSSSANTWKTGSREIKHFWSAAMVSSILGLAGLRPLRTQSALDYAMYGREIDWRDWSKVRKYDIAVFKFRNASGGHVGFISEVNLAQNKIKIYGGNQLNQYKETEYLISNVDMYLLTIRRNWTDPGEDYKAVIG